jgi:hypothetical protein
VPDLFTQKPTALALETELVHRGQAGPHRPSRCNGRRRGGWAPTVEVDQPRAHALNPGAVLDVIRAAAARLQRDEQGRGKS